MNQLTFFFIAYTALTIVVSLIMIHASALHLSRYNQMRMDIMHYLSFRTKAEDKTILSALAHLNEDLERSSLMWNDVRADEEVFFRSGGKSEDLQSIRKDTRQGFNARVLPIILQEG